MATEFHANMYIVSPPNDMELVSTSIRVAGEHLNGNIVSFTIGYVVVNPSPVPALLALESWANEQLDPQPAPQRHEAFLVITEFDLHEMSCYEFLERIRGNRNSRYIHVMVMDWVYAEERHRGCRERGAHYFPKPMDIYKMEFLKQEYLRVEFERQEAIEEARRQKARRQEAQRQLESNKRKRKRCTSKL